MGSYSEKINLLENLRSRSQVDCDSLDIERELVASFSYLLRAVQSTCGANSSVLHIVARQLGPFVDSTSNQVVFTQPSISAHSDRYTCWERGYTDR